jgi:hypothetical protein
MERRRFQRLKTRVPLYGRARVPGDDVQGLVMNVGLGGFSFESPRPLARMERYGFELATPPGVEPEARLAIQGQIRWSSPSEEDPALHWIGVMFEFADDAQRATVAAFVEHHTLPAG